MGRRQWKLLCAVFALGFLAVYNWPARHDVVLFLRSIWGFVTSQHAYLNTTRLTVQKGAHRDETNPKTDGADEFFPFESTPISRQMRQQDSRQQNHGTDSRPYTVTMKDFELYAGQGQFRQLNSRFRTRKVTDPFHRCGTADASCRKSLANAGESDTRQTAESAPDMNMKTLTGQKSSFLSQRIFKDRSGNERLISGRKRYLVYLCDAEKRCGGWADRQRGILSVFLLAIVTRRIFKIDMRSPCNLTNFLHPITEDWWSWERDMVTDSNVVVDDIRGAVLARALQAGRDVNVRFPHTVMYVRISRDLAPLLFQHPQYQHLLPTWALAKTQAERFGVGWNLLAASTRSLQQRLHKVMTPTSMTAVHEHANNSSLVCAHVRMGRNPTIPEDPNVRNNVSAVHLVFDFLQDVLDTYHHPYVFIATDDHSVRTAARKRFGARLLDSGGNIVHIDRQSSHLDACAGFESTIVDQLVLSKCHVLVISRSGFSKHAAYLRQRTDGLFLLQQGTIAPYRLT